MRLCVYLFVIFSLIFCGGCDHVRYQDNDKSLSFSGKNLSTEYTIGDLRLSSLHIDDATGTFRGEDLRFFLKNGDLAMNFLNSSTNTTANFTDQISIRHAELVDLRNCNPIMTSEIFCIGSFNVSQNVGTTKTNQTEEI